MRALLWPLFDRSAWAQPATMAERRTLWDTALASVRSVVVRSASHCGGGHDCCGFDQASVRSIGVGSASHRYGGSDRLGRFNGLCSLDRRDLIQPMWGLAHQVRALLCSLFARSAWCHPATVLSSDRMVGVGSAMHCGGGQDRGGRCNGVLLVGVVSASDCGGDYDW
jgi:hypothetical protein